jgi:hypothetical protein
VTSEQLASAEVCTLFDVPALSALGEVDIRDGAFYNHCSAFIYLTGGGYADLFLSIAPKLYTDESWTPPRRKWQFTTGNNAL